MHLYFLLALIFSSTAMAQDCQFEIKDKDIKLTWTAYKTPMKAGVSGTFNDLGVPKMTQAESLGKALEALKFDIKTQTVNTKDSARDKKIATFFFKPLGSSIQGRVLSYKKKVLQVELTFNGVKKTIPMKVETTDNSFTATGVMDILDFNASSALSSINKACSELHQGKTWSDVALKLESKFWILCE